MAARRAQGDPRTLANAERRVDAQALQSGMSQTLAIPISHRADRTR